jgi:polar amino acid transport system substrate-binding protein
MSIYGCFSCLQVVVSLIVYLYTTWMELIGMAKRQDVRQWILALSATLLWLCAAPDRSYAEDQARYLELPPAFANCGDGSFEKALKEGVTLGIGPTPPYGWIDPDTKEIRGIDAEINQAVLSYLGIKIKNWEVMPFGQLIPALLSSRIDIIANNIHVTPARIEAVSFTGPAWWFGPAIIVQKGNPQNIRSLADLKGKDAGAMLGTAGDEYLRNIGANVTPFKTTPEHFVAVAQGRLIAVMEDDVKFAWYKKQNPDVPLEMITVDLPEKQMFATGYGYCRYALRKDNCSLRAAYTAALAELRGNGRLHDILKKYGLGSSKSVMFYDFN